MATLAPSATQERPSLPLSRESPPAPPTVAPSIPAAATRNPRRPDGGSAAAPAGTPRGEAGRRGGTLRGEAGRAAAGLLGRRPGRRGPGGSRGQQSAGSLPGSYLVGVGDVDRLSVLRHVADDALAPGHLHLVAVLGGAAGQQRRAGVHVEELGDQALLAGGGPLHEEEGAPVGVHHEADEDEDLVAEAGEVQVVGDVLDQLQEELALVVLLEVALVVQGGGGVLGQADAGLQQGAEDVGGSGGQGAGLPQQSSPPHAAQRLLRPGVHMLVVGEVDVNGLGAGEALPQLLLGSSPLQPPTAGAATAPPVLRRAGGGGGRRFREGVLPLQPLLHQLRVPL